MASKDVAPLLGKEFVSVKIDSDRMPGGQDLLKRLAPKSSGIPWFAFLDGEGRILITCDGPNGHVGFPAQPHEIAHFKTMLEKVKRNLSDEDIAKLIKSLEDANKTT